MIEHLKSPWVIGGGALLVVLLVMGKSGTGTNGSNGALGVASQGVATSANVQLAGLSSEVSMERDQTSASRDVATLGLALGYLNHIDDNNVVRASTQAAVDMKHDENSTLIRLTSGNNETFVKIAPQLAQISASNSQALAGIASSEAQAIASINANAMITATQLNKQQSFGQSLAGTGIGLGALGSGLGNFASGIGSLFGL